MLPDAVTTGNLRAEAQSVLNEIEDVRARFDVMADGPGRRVHCLFAGLYWYSTRAWLSSLAKRSNPEFAYLVIVRFYALYREALDAGVENDMRDVPRHWKRYFDLAGRQTYAHPISAHLMLISLAARAHARHDLVLAIRRAQEDFQRRFGKIPDLGSYKSTVVGHETDDAFRTAALDYIDLHYRSQRGWRRFVLRFYSAGIKFLRFVWLPVFQSWRRAAWDDACLLPDRAIGRRHGAG